jgi:uncharacterized protein involved in type VI secretion and phage assembly
VGKRFSGQYRLKKVTHTIDDHGYRTRFEVSQRDGTGLLPLLRKKIAELAPPNEVKTVDGVAVAKVTNNVDPEARGRVKLSFPWFSDDYESDWTRCATPMAGSGVGTYFLPDVGDEVLVAFTQGDFNAPVVLGGLWNGVARPPLTVPNPRNLVRLIKTKAGHTITIDELQGIVIKDQAGNTITLDSKTGKIQITSGLAGVTIEGGRWAQPGWAMRSRRRPQWPRGLLPSTRPSTPWGSR